MTPLLLSAALAAAHPPGFPGFGNPYLPPNNPYLPPGPGFVPPPGPDYPGPMTVDFFVKCFRPCPGPHKVCLIHPKTGKPVEVCFVLPDCGFPPKVNAGRRYVEFDYGKKEVEIRFRHHGTVDVQYD